MNDFELKINEGSIQTNLDSLKAELTEVASKYEGVVVSEDAIPIAKKDLAGLRKLAKEIDDRRKQVKKDWNKPYTDFENEVKSALEILDKPINLIDGQIKEFDKAKKAEKEKHCRELFDANVGDLAEYITYESVFRDAWLNVSTKDNEILSDISGARVKVRADLDAIRALSTEFEAEVVDFYKKTGSLSDAIQRNTQLISAKQMAEKRVAEEQARKEEPPVIETVNGEPKKCYATYTVRAKTEEESENLRQMFEFNNYEFSVIY